MIDIQKLENLNVWLRALRSSRTLLVLITLACLALLAVDLLGGCHCGEAVLSAATIVTGVAGGKHVVDGPLTTDITREEAPGLLLNEVDQQIVKIRPMATPLDQLARYAGSKRAGSMVVDYHNVDTKPTKATVSQTLPESSSAPRVTLHTSCDEIFDQMDTILVQGVHGYDENGTTPTAQELVLYVHKRDEQGLTVSAVNGRKNDDDEICVPPIYQGASLVRMGRAASELDVMTPQFEALPQRAQQFCQIFKMQVEQSMLQKLSNKSVDWTMSDQEEAAIYDMRLGMEKSFLFGVKRRVWDNSRKENVLFTGGIWHQAAKQYTYDDDGFTQESIVDLMREAFTGNAGSKRKILLGGSELIGSLNKLDYTRVVTSADSVTKWGIDFTELKSKFGTLYVLLSEVFDECGMAECGMIIDPEYIQKYTHIPFNAQTLDLKASGQRNVEAVVLSEASCLVLRYPKAHMRIIKE